jgi:hypothetical protein
MKIACSGIGCRLRRKRRRAGHYRRLQQYIWLIVACRSVTIASSPQSNLASRTSGLKPQCVLREDLLFIFGADGRDVVDIALDIVELATCDI